MQPFLNHFNFVRDVNKFDCIFAGNICSALAFKEDSFEISELISTMNSMKIKISPYWFIFSTICIIC